jgi:hypothetical protein
MVTNLSTFWEKLFLLPQGGAITMEDSTSSQSKSVFKNEEITVILWKGKIITSRK